MWGSLANRSVPQIFLYRSFFLWQLGSYFFHSPYQGASTMRSAQCCGAESRFDTNCFMFSAVGPYYPCVLRMSWRKGISTHTPAGASIWISGVPLLSPGFNNNEIKWISAYVTVYFLNYNPAILKQTCTKALCSSHLCGHHSSEGKALCTCSNACTDSNISAVCGRTPPPLLRTVLCNS